MHRLTLLPLALLLTAASPPELADHGVAAAEADPDHGIGDIVGDGSPPALDASTSLGVDTEPWRR